MRHKVYMLQKRCHPINCFFYKTSRTISNKAYSNYNNNNKHLPFHLANSSLYSTKHSFKWFKHNRKEVLKVTRPKDQCILNNYRRTKVLNSKIVNNFNKTLNKYSLKIKENKRVNNQLWHKFSSKKVINLLTNWKIPKNLRTKCFCKLTHQEVLEL